MLYLMLDCDNWQQFCYTYTSKLNLLLNKRLDQSENTVKPRYKEVEYNKTLL